MIADPVGSVLQSGAVLDVQVRGAEVRALHRALATLRQHARPE
ncbi:MAG: hypothetical protein AB7O97_17250 [Planctomycetota bacterium]